MCASLRTDLRTLAPEQIATLRQYAERWVAIRRSTQPANRSAAEDGVRHAYRAAGLDPPQRMVWCGGPIELADLTRQLPRTDGPNVSSILIHNTEVLVVSALKRHVHPSILVQIANAFRNDAANAAVSNAVLRNVRPLRLSLFGRLRWAFSLLDAQSPRADLSRGLIGQHQLAWLGLYDYLRDVCGLETETAPTQGLSLFAKHAGWMLPHKHACWLAERPSILQVDARGRLHSAKGPALHYPDGWSLYAWKGIQVPAWVIERPDKITIRAIDRESDRQVRRCMIELMTPERFVLEGGAVRVVEDKTGVLWRREWGLFDAWAAVEVVNGTPELDGKHKHYFLQVPPGVHTPLEAVAWTYGLPPGRYAYLTLRT
jgi:hypothetical protein